MNTHEDYLAELHRQEILKEAKHIQLEKLALGARVYHPSLFTQTMFNFANWMITTGKQLRRRYEIPTVHCTGTPTSNPAH